MRHGHDPYRRFGVTALEVSRVRATIANTPPLPVVDYAAVGQTAPLLLRTPAGALPKASAVVITWAEAEWAAMQQVFCANGATMPYSDRTRSDWDGWQTYAQNLPSGAPSGWTEWGSYRLVEVGGKPVLLFKSNTHLDYPGASFLETLIRLLIPGVEPALILSIGTAGGAKQAALRSASYATCRTRCRTRPSRRKCKGAGAASSMTHTASTRAIMARSPPGRRLRPPAEEAQSRGSSHDRVAGSRRRFPEPDRAFLR